MSNQIDLDGIVPDKAIKLIQGLQSDPRYADQLDAELRSIAAFIEVFVFNTHTPVLGPIGVEDARWITSMKIWLARRAFIKATIYKLGEFEGET